MNAPAEPTQRAGRDPVVFTVAEGQALDILAALLGRGRGDLFARPMKLETLRPELLDAGARRVANTVMRWMVEEGGWRDRVLLRGRERTHGRVWDAPLGDGFAFRYTPASRGFWLECVRLLPELVGKIDTGSAEAERRPRKSLRDLTLASTTATGDWVFFALAHRGVETFRLDRGDQTAIQHKLRLASPVAALLHPDPAMSEGDLRSRFALLARPDAARIVECGEARFSRAWAQYADATTRSREAPTEVTRRWAALGRTVTLWLDAIDRARRMDLARPLLRFSAELTRGAFAKGAEAVRAQFAGTAVLRSMAERDALLGAVASVASLSSALFRRRDELAAERYGDERYEEAQVFLRDVEETLQPVRRQAEGVSRALAGTIG